METNEKLHNETPDYDVLTETEVAAVLRVSTGTLANWRWRRSGPTYMKIGSSVRYPRAALIAFMQSATIEPCRAA